MFGRKPVELLQSCKFTAPKSEGLGSDESVKVEETSAGRAFSAARLDLTLDASSPWPASVSLSCLVCPGLQRAGFARPPVSPVGCKQKECDCGAGGRALQRNPAAVSKAKSR